MYAIPGIFLIVTAIYARPQELSSTLGSIPLLHVCFGLAVFGLLLDIKLGRARLGSTPLLVPVVAFLLWVFFTSVSRAPTSAPTHALELAICGVLCLLIAHGAQSFRALGAIAAAVVAMVLLVSVVAVEQSFAPTGCVQLDDSRPGDTAAGRYDGRPCNVKNDCYATDGEPGADYMCEHVGLLGTTSIGNGRVRYRGVLQDPNELSLAGAIGLPLAFALARARRKSLGRDVLVALLFVLVAVCIVLTRSRTGQLVFLAILAVPFSRRFGVRGLVLAGLVSLPLLLLGGRSGGEAATSTLERADCWAEALSIWRVDPLFGVGLSQFGRYHYLTAHNSYLLTLAELGLPGMLLFSSVVYVALKIPFVAWRATSAPDSALSREEARDIVRIWSSALLAALSGLALGIFFLSFAYHYVFWIYVGLSGALYSAIRRHDPEFRVRFGVRDLASLALVDVAIIVVVYSYTRYLLG